MTISKLEEAKEILAEVHGFVSAGPRAQEGIDAALNLIDEHIAHLSQPQPVAQDEAVGGESDMRYDAGFEAGWHKAKERFSAPTIPTSHRVVPVEIFDFVDHLQRQRDWSVKTFGPGSRADGVVDHIRKELMEIEADPTDLKEWIDVVILALDGAWRSGAHPQEIVNALVGKQTKNEGRVWPDWRTADPTKAIEHDRTHDAGGV